VKKILIQDCKGNSQIPLFQLCDSCDTLQFLQLCAIIHLKSHTELQHLFITQYVLHIVYPYHVIPLSISVPCYCHPTPSPSHFTYYFQYFLYFLSSPYLSSMIHCWLLCTLFLIYPPFAWGVLRVFSLDPPCKVCIPQLCCIYLIYFESLHKNLSVMLDRKVALTVENSLLIRPKVMHTTIIG